MAMNNTIALMAVLAKASDDPKAWLDENIGNPYWTAVEQKLFEHYKEQRKELTK